MKQWLSAPVLYFLGKFQMRLPWLAINAIITVDVNGSIGYAEVSIHGVTCEDSVINTILLFSLPV